MSADGGGWYGATDTWPKHKSSHFRDLLAKARRRGWVFRESGGSSHIFGRLYCDYPSEVANPCKLAVFSTGRAGETKAREFEIRIENCPHRAVSELPAAARVEQFIDTAERLLDAADRLITSDESEQRAMSAWARAEELIEAAADNADEAATALIHAADVDERAARAVRAEAERLLEPTALSADQGSQAVLDAAETMTNQARAEVRRLTPRATRQALVQRIESVRSNLKLLRDRMSEV